jgi:hypothetical protein
MCQGSGGCDGSHRAGVPVHLAAVVPAAAALRWSHKCYDQISRQQEPSESAASADEYTPQLGSGADHVQGCGEEDIAPQVVEPAEALAALLPGTVHSHGE